jgi:hypothetical protein
MISTLILSGILMLDNPPVAYREMAGIVVVENAEWASCLQATGVVEGYGGPDGRTFGFPSADGFIVFSVPPETDVFVSAAWTPPGQTPPTDPPPGSTWSPSRTTLFFELPVERVHRVETTVRMMVESWRRVVEYSVNFFEIEYWRNVIRDEQDNSNPEP